MSNYKKTIVISTATLCCALLIFIFFATTTHKDALEKNAGAFRQLESSLHKIQTALQNSLSVKSSTAFNTHPIPKTSEFAFTTETLKNTYIDGWLDIDTRGHFISNKNALRVFDYFLLTTGEIGESTAIDYIKNYILDELNPPADTEALSFLQQYLNFRDAVKIKTLETQNSAANNTLNGKPRNFEDTLENYRMLQAMRNAYFGKALSAQLFDTQDEIQQLQRLKLMMDNNLSASAKEKKAQEILANTPQEQKDFYLQMEQQKTINEKIAQMKKAGANSDDIWQYRESVWGSDAADRLAALDEQNALWQQRLSNFQVQKTTIENNTIMTSTQKVLALDHLLQRSFSPTERLRVSALDAY